MSMKQKKQKQPLSKTFKKIATNKVLYIMLVPCMIYTFILSVMIQNKSEGSKKIGTV